jgi:tetratricopeptide (TPR) repeat protein
MDMSIYNYLGSMHLYSKKGSIDSAFYYFKLIIDSFSHDLRRWPDVGQAIYNYANIFTRKDETDSALYYHKKALELRLKIIDLDTFGYRNAPYMKRQVAYSAFRISQIYEREKKYETALSYLDTALFYAFLSYKDIESSRMLVTYIHFHQGLIYTSMENYVAAMENYNKSLENAKKINDIQGIRSALKMLSNLSFDQAVNYSKELKKYRMKSETGSTFIAENEDIISEVNNEIKSIKILRIYHVIIFILALALVLVIGIIFKIKLDLERHKKRKDIIAELIHLSKPN